MVNYKEIKIDMMVTPEMILEQLSKQGEARIRPVQDKKSDDDEDTNTKK